MPVSLNVVLLEVLEQRLRSATAAEVLAELSDQNDQGLIAPFDQAAMRLALVSYKQEPDPDKNAIRMSPSSLISIVAVAKREGVSALWCDLWCYREPGEYVHEKFIQTLSDVTNSIHCVIWLPTSRKHSMGEYQYRLWCTYEAFCTLERRLPVHIAGRGMTLFQRWLCALGSYAPALWADGTIGDLCRLNLIFYFAEVGTLFAGIVLNGAARVSVLIFVFALFLVEFPAMWIAARFCFGQQVRLAQSGCHVLRVMSRDIERRPASKGHVELLANLPWLPCTSRRDALKIQELLGMLRPDLALRMNEFLALCFSAYCAARVLGDEVARPRLQWVRSKSTREVVNEELSAVLCERCKLTEDEWKRRFGGVDIHIHHCIRAGDDYFQPRSALNQSLREWLADVNINLHVPSNDSADGVVDAEQAGGGVELQEMNWLDLTEPDTPAPRWQCLRMQDLCKFGWFEALGVSCAIVCPIACWPVAPPTANGAHPKSSSWTLFPDTGAVAEPLQDSMLGQRYQSRIGFSLAVYLLLGGFTAIGTGVMRCMVLTRVGTFTDILNGSIASMTFSMIMPIVVLILCFYADGRMLYFLRRFPLPYFIVSNPKKMAAWTALKLANVGLFTYLVYEADVKHDFALMLFGSHDAQPVIYEKFALVLYIELLAFYAHTGFICFIYVVAYRVRSSHDSPGPTTRVLS